MYPDGVAFLPVCFKDVICSFLYGDDCQIVDWYFFNCLKPPTSQLYGEGWLGW